MRPCRLLAGLLALVAVLASARPASACSPPIDEMGRPITVENTDGTVEDPLVWSLAVAGVIDATFLGLDLGYGVQGRTLPHAGAVLEGIVGVAHFVGATILGFGGLFEVGDSCGSPSRGHAMWGASATMTVLGGWFLSHAIWSTRVPEGPSIRPTVGFGPTGGQLGLTGRF